MSYHGATKEACKNGHPWTPESSYISTTTREKACRICRRERDAKRRERVKKNEARPIWR